MAPTGGPAWFDQLREAARAAQAQVPVPSAREEVWRYTPIDDLELGRYRLPEAGETMPVSTGIAALVTINLLDGRVVGIESSPADLTGLTVTTATTGAQGLSEVPVPADDDHLLRYHHGYAHDAVVLEVARGASIDGPIVLHHVATAAPHSVSLPWLSISLGEGSSCQVVEVYDGGGSDVLTLPVTEVSIAAGAHLRHVALQRTEIGTWHLARQLAQVERDGTFESFSVGLGASFDRVRTDVAVVGRGASSRLRSVYLGTEDQLHDVRTIQDHQAGHSTSDLLCKGAVADRARSVYTGTIRIRNGAIRSDAVQNNHNLVLGDGAQAESVPNLDILENDVRCAHGSTVGPVDEEQRYYLESRGIAPEVAERLLVAGFFEDVLDQLPIPAVRALVHAELAQRLATISIGGAHA